MSSEQAILSLIAQQVAQIAALTQENERLQRQNAQLQAQIMVQEEAGRPDD